MHMDMAHGVGICFSHPLKVEILAQLG